MRAEERLLRVYPHISPSVSAAIRVKPDFDECIYTPLAVCVCEMENSVQCDSLKPVLEAERQDRVMYAKTIQISSEGLHPWSQKTGSDLSRLKKKLRSS